MIERCDVKKRNKALIATATIRNLDLQSTKAAISGDLSNKQFKQKRNTHT